MPRGYSLDALADVIIPAVQSNLSVDLNTLYGRDNEGKYYQAGNANATADKHYPVQEAGILEVLVHHANGLQQSMQRYTTYSSGRMFWRTQSGSQSTGWSAWDEFAKMSLIYKQVYPVGIELQFGASVNPNTLFPGTKWTQITDGRVIRSSVNNTVGNNAANGDIGTTGGNESMTLGTNHLPGHTHEVPVHSHTMAHVHNMSHGHTVPAHSHTMAHVHNMSHGHTVPAHSHTMAHNHTVNPHSHGASASTSIASNGAHVHGIKGATANNLGSGASNVDGHYANKIYHNTESAGAHSHTASTSVSIANSATLTTNGSSAANTGTQAATAVSAHNANTGASSAANTGTQAATAVSSLTSNTGGSSAANTGGSTPGMQTGKGPVTNNPFNLTNPFRRVAVWRRTA